MMKAIILVDQKFIANEVDIKVLNPVSYSPRQVVGWREGRIKKSLSVVLRTLNGRGNFQSHPQKVRRNRFSALKKDDHRFQFDF